MRGTILAVAVLMFAVGQVVAGPIDPLGFLSLGSFATSGTNTTYTINTSNTPTLTFPNGTTIDGVVYADTPGHNLAVFDFSSINVAAGTTITATGSLPLVLLSQSDAIIGGTINASGATMSISSFSGAGGPGGGGSSNTGSNALAGPGAGSYTFEGGGGGGFGGEGAAGGIYTGINGMVSGPASGGQTYGNLSVSLQGGSAGGGELGSGPPGGGAGGGGALEIGATGELHVLGTGSILANGGSIVGQPIAGGGSGGGIFLHANAIVLDMGALISAQGGGGGFSIFVGGPGGGSGGGGGGGGGGRVLFDFGPGGISIASFGDIDVSGGSSGFGMPGTGAAQGGAGQLAFSQFVTPEPSSILMLSLGLAAVAVQSWRRRLAA